MKPIIRITGTLGLLSYLLCGQVAAQRPDTLFNRIFTNATSATAPFIVGNIGQDIHNVLIRYTDVAGGGGCATSAGLNVIYLEGSFTTTVWVVIGKIKRVGYSKDDNGQLTATIFARGSYPYVRIRIFVNDNANCLVQGWYSGNIAGQNTEAPVYDSSQENYDTPTVALGGALAGNNVLILPSPNVTLYFYAATVANKTGGQRVIIKCSGGTEVLRLLAMIAGQSVVIPNTGRAFGFCPVGEGLTLNLLNASAVGVSLKYGAR